MEKKNQKSKQLYKKKIKKILKFSLLKKKSFSFTILLTNSSRMKYLNKKFRKKNKATDVLSFPSLDTFNFKKKNKKNFYLGDIALSYEIINKRSKMSNFEFEFDKMWIHGYLHLLGYNHKKLTDYKVMKQLEIKILKIL